MVWHLGLYLRVRRRLIFVAAIALLCVASGAAGSAGVVHPTDQMFAELAVATFPAHLLPAQPTFIGLFEIDLPPYTELITEAETTPPGVGVTYVESGTYAITVQGPVWVARVSGEPASWKEETSREEIVLQQGQAVVFPRLELPRAERSVGNAPAILLTVIVTSPLGIVPYEYPAASPSAAVRSVPLAYVLPPAPIPRTGSLTVALARASLDRQSAPLIIKGVGTERLIVEEGAILFSGKCGSLGVTRKVKFTHVNEVPLVKGSVAVLQPGDYANITAGSIGVGRVSGASQASVLLLSVTSQEEPRTDSRQRPNAWGNESR